MNSILNDLRTRISCENTFSIYCAGEFAYIFVEWIFRNDLADRFENIMVSDGEKFNPVDILGVPVVPLSKCDINKDSLIIIACLSEHTHKAIRNSLTQAGYTNIYDAFSAEYREMNRELIDFSADIRTQIRNLRQQTEEVLKMNYHLLALVEHNYASIMGIIQSMPMIAATHNETFGQFKDINKGKTMVVAGTGPSLNEYTYNKKYLHIGVNSMCFNKNIKMDYYFIQDIPQQEDALGLGGGVNPEYRKKLIHSIKELDTIKFVGQHLAFQNDKYGFFQPPPLGTFSSDDKYRKYYFVNEETETAYYCKDIRYGLLWGDDSIVFPAMQFALFTNPRKIYIVGCDGFDAKSASHWNKEEDDVQKEMHKEKLLFSERTDRMRKRWIALNKFIHVNYPDVDVVMVNPKSFKGIFRETTTDNKGNIIEV